MQLLKHRDEPNTLISDSEMEVAGVQVNELPDACPTGLFPIEDVVIF
ncbi:MAG: hypothetical protein R3B84_21475 [Zavarzinella sp.]